ncbi:MAG: hypothetical protein CVU45_00920 [Chloroflexi bacterium HGW-Chloroflexi-7]|nr:MAG: hypothetical protein CVU45_00920 [Chloroflexi bacterium HGW-Chloroflexi-7]
MKQPYDHENREELREKIIGLGEKSIQKSYYPELQKRLSELERFRALLDQSTDYFFLIKIPSGIIEDVTISTANLLGYIKDEITNQSINNFVASSDELRNIFTDKKITSENERYILDSKLIRKDGASVSVEIAFSPVIFDKNRYFVAIARDNTVRKQNEEAIHQLNVTLEQRIATRTMELQIAIQELESFSYSVSHDLRSPLRSLDGFSSILLEDYSQVLDDKGKQYLNKIKQSSLYLSSLVNGLLEISHTNRSPITCETFNLSEIVEQIAGELQNSEPSREVKWNISPGVIVDADPVLMKTTLMNLLQNAWKFSRGKMLAEISFGQENQGDKTIFFVKDNGAGFDMQNADRLFNPFQRFHADDQFEGTGIGLAIVARIIHKHGGEIWAESAPDQGAIFYFTLSKRLPTK